MEKPKNMRVKKTFIALIEATFSLLEDSRFEEITVQDICREAHVHRATFYRHFEDKAEFFEFCAETVFKEYIPSFEGEIRIENHREHFFEIVSRVFTYLEINRRMVKLSIEANNSGTMMNLVKKATNSAILSLLAEYEKQGLVLLVPIDLLSEFYTDSIITILRWWLFSGTAASKDEALSCVEILIDPNNHVKLV